MKATKRLSSAMLVMTLAVSLAACSHSIVGVYVHDKNDKEYLELRSDATFFLREHGMGLSGKYRVDGEVITLTMDGGMSTQGKIHGQTLVDEDGESWIRR